MQDCQRLRSAPSCPGCGYQPGAVWGDAHRFDEAVAAEGHWWCLSHADLRSLTGATVASLVSSAAVGAVNVTSRALVREGAHPGDGWVRQLLLG